MAPKNDTIFLQGKASWCKLFKPDNEFHNWNLKLHLTPESYNIWQTLKETRGEFEGILNEAKKDDDGVYVTLRRPTEKDFGKGRKENLLPPEVLDKDNNPLRQDPGIGNGSDVTVKLQRYSYRKPFGKGYGSAIRLEAVRIDNLVPFQRSDLNEDEEKLVEGIEKKPPVTNPF